MNNFFTIQENQAQQFYWFDQVFTHQELKWIEDGVSNIPYTRADVIGEHTEDRKSNIKYFTLHDISHCLSSLPILWTQKYITIPIY